MRRMLQIGGITCVVLLAGANICRAQIPIQFGNGEKIYHVADIAGNPHAMVGTDSYELGYKFKHFSIMWCPLFHWGGTYCLYKGDQYIGLSEDPAGVATALGVPEAKVHKPFLYWIPWGWFVLVPVLIGIIAMKSADTSGGAATAQNVSVAQALLQDPKYRKALEIAADGGNLNINAGIDYLRTQGVSRDEAQQKMMIIVSAVASAKA